ncbi:ABC transporter permease [Aliikangiella maris]|uniref:ABC transporter permease subunit n=2 Tax=Aliikangiella maris TaxID=3162458 RepID=A0ABV3MNR8_9GAMM
MKALINIMRGVPRYLWSGWGALSSIFLLIALWDYAHQSYGQLVLPAPKDSFIALWQMFQQGDTWQDIQLTFKRAILSWVIVVGFGSVIGMVAGLFVTTSMMTRPLMTIFMGMPPIAWIILSMIWFGMSDTSVIFTIVVAAFPLVFIGALQGTRTLDNDLREMAQSFNASRWMMLTDVYFPHLFSYLFPSWITALGQSWKIVVMAELLSTNNGVGAALAVARTQLDTVTALALVVIMVGSLLVVEYLLLEPIKREVEQWRK